MQAANSDMSWIPQYVADQQASSKRKDTKGLPTHFPSMFPTKYYTVPERLAKTRTTLPNVYGRKKI
jgi:hypothetical protein